MVDVSGCRLTTMTVEISQVLIIANILQCICTCESAMDISGQAYVQTDTELRYVVEGVPADILSSQSHQKKFHDAPSIYSSVYFIPPSLDFNVQYIGMPSIEQVTVLNTDISNNLHLLSISGSTQHFHCSFFQDKTVPPGGNTTFEIVFLARQEGSVENTLYIHTSLGSFKYKVFGKGVPNPYRIRSIIGAKLPLNSSFSPLIRMHNPHGSTLQVVEMYSSGGDLHLELPTGDEEAPKNLWELKPYETKPVIRANFIGRIESNHTGFIRIKTNSESRDEILILPVEVEVTSSPGLFSQTEIIDFGLLRTHDKAKSVRLNLLNSGPDPIHISSISVSPPNDAVHIEFRPIKIQPDSLQATSVAIISFTASKALEHKMWKGNLLVKSNNGQFKLTIPYQANVLHGMLIYNRSATTFYSGKGTYSKEIRELSLTNTFNCTLVLYNASLPSSVSNCLKIKTFPSPITLKSQETSSVLKLEFHCNSDIHLTTELIIFSNASTFHIPIVIYNGKLRVINHQLEVMKGQLDFGTLGIGENRNMTFTLRNDNPVDIYIKDFQTNLSRSNLILMGIEEGNGTTLTRDHNSSIFNSSNLLLKPYHFAVFILNLIAPNLEGTYSANAVIDTQYEKLYLPITMKTAEGSLHASHSKIVFLDCFPGKICSQELKVNSSFQHKMEIQEIDFQPIDPRFYYTSPINTTTLIEPLSQTNVGKIHFDAKRICLEDCYLGLSTFIPAGHQWLLGAVLNKEVADTDQYLFSRFRQKWDLIEHQQLSIINATIQLDTNQVKGFLFPAQAHLHWPQLSSHKYINFPLTQLGNISIKEITVENPADLPVLMQILTLPLYPNPKTIIDLLNPSLMPGTNDYIEMDDNDIFTLQDLEKFTPDLNNPFPGLRRNVENTLGVRPHKSTLTMIVGMGAKVKVRIGFRPKDDIPRTSLILIRNNLTIIDAIVVHGQGGRGELRFSNRKADSNHPLMFELTTDKNLRACEKRKPSKALSPSFIKKRTFTARNTGQLPFYVHSFNINGSPCEGYGFRVLECEGFELLPNTSRKIDIVFTPDFTMSRMRRTLSILTSLGQSMNFTLQATVPAAMLSKCAAALPRPVWEPIFYYSSVCVMTFLLFIVLVASYFESDIVFTADIMKRRAKVCSSTQTFDRSKIFDLRAIAGIKSPSDPSSSNIPLNNNLDTSMASNSFISNSYIERDKKENCSVFDRIQKFINHNILLKIHSPSNSVIQKQFSNEAKDNQITEQTLCPKTDKYESVEKIPVSKFPVNKKIKIGKRQNNIDVNDLASLQVHEKRTVQNDVVHLDCNNGTVIVNKLDNDKNTNVTKSNHLKKTISYEFLLPENEADPSFYVEDNDDVKNGKRVPSRRNKASNKDKANSEFNHQVKDHARNLELISDQDKDDSSSTTTDSSSPEQEEKNNIIHELAQENVSCPKRKNKVKKERKNNNADNFPDDDVFTSKTKYQHKTKADSKNFTNNNVTDSSSLDHSFKQKSETDNYSTGSSEFQRKNSKPHRFTKSKGEILKRAESCDIEIMEHYSSCISLPCPWDSPTKSGGDLSEIANQTEAFAASFGRNRSKSAGPLMTPNDINSAENSKVKNSYSSVVSNGGNVSPPLANNQFLRKSPKPNNLMLDLNKANAFSNISFKEPCSNADDGLNNRNGIHYMREPPASNLGLMQNCNPWSNSYSNPPTPEISSASQYSPNPFNDLGLPMSDKEIMPQYNAVSPNVHENSGGFPVMNSNSAFEHVTMMQRLHAERRKRQRDYQMKLYNWPGFDIGMQQESLWDPNVNNSSDSWVPFSGTQPSLNTNSQMNSDLTTPSNSLFWNSDRTSTGTWTAPESNLWNTSVNSIEKANDGNISPISTSAIGSYNPFYASESIWHPNNISGIGTGSGWGVPSKPDDEHL